MSVIDFPKTPGKNAYLRRAIDLLKVINIIK